MASREYKNQWLENFQNKLEGLIAEKIIPQDTDSMNKAIDEIVSRHQSRDLGIRQMRAILEKYDIPDRLYQMAANATLLASAIEIGFENRENLTDSQKKSIQPVMKLAQRSPGKSAETVVRVAEKEDKAPDWTNDALIYLAAANSKRTRSKYIKDLKKSKQFNRRTVARQIRRDVKNRRKQLKKAEQMQVAESIKKKWRTRQQLVVEGRKKTGMLTESYSRRYIESEVHNQTEAVKATDASVRGIKYKQWITQADEKVRQTHRLLHNQTIGVNDKFNVGGVEASYPGDSSLPIGEKINCRCKLTYKNNLF